ncbi:MAG: SprT family zinc-dependent metalloprotease [Thermodesulfobacteriota bacterium]
MSLPRGVVAYGNNNIEFSFFYVKRKTLEIAVHPDQAVVIKAPLGTDIEEIKRKVIKRAAWIKKQRTFFRQFEPRTPARRYVGGETHLYLGRHYRLRIQKGEQDAVRLRKGFFEIQVKEKITSERIRGLLEEWYREKAKVKFNESLDRCWVYVKKVLKIKPTLQMRSMKKRWGSLSPQGRLTLNLELIKAPPECIDYVVVHELSHLRYEHHGPEFYAFLDKVMPDWEKRKHRLEVTLA